MKSKIFICAFSIVLLSGIVFVSQFNNKEIASTYALSGFGGQVGGQVNSLQEAREKSKEALESLPVDLQKAVKESFKRQELEAYAIKSEGESFVAPNPAQGYVSTFNKEGFLVEDQQNDWSLQMKLTSWGWQNSSLKNLNSNPETTISNQDTSTLEIEHNGLTEWYINKPSGLEQGFTVFNEPQGKDETNTLAFNLEINTALNIQVEPSNKSLTLNDDQGNHLRYTKLLAFDANNKTLPAWLELNENQLTLLVDTQNAQYPLTIDPTIVTNEKKILPSDGKEGDNFGISVAVDGNVAVVGAYQIGLINEMGLVTGDKGAAYVFRFDGVNWNQEAKLEASDGKLNDLFGGSVAVDGDLIIVGRAPFQGGRIISPLPFPFFTHILPSDSGAAYIFRFDGVNWNEEAKLTDAFAPPTNPFGLEPNDLFGYFVDIENDVALVGDPYQGYFNFLQLGPKTGPGYIFRFDGTNWNLEAQLIDPNSEGAVTTSGALSGERVVLGSPLAPLVDLNKGKTQIFTHQGNGNWTLETELLTTEGQSFPATSVDIEGDVVAASFGSVASIGIVSGKASIFRRISGTTWVEEAKLSPSDGNGGGFADGFSFDGFGSCIALLGNLALVGSEHLNGAYLFENQGNGNWVEQAKVIASDGIPSDPASSEFTGDCFAVTSVALSTDQLFVGAFCDDDNGPESGSTYAYDIINQDTTNPILVSAPPVNLCPQDSLTFSIIVEDIGSGINLATSQVSFKNKTGSVIQATAIPLSGNQVQYSATFPAGTNPGEVQADGIITDNASPPNTLAFSNVKVGKILAIPSAQGETQGPNFTVVYTGNHPFDSITAAANNPDGTTGTAQLLTTLPAQIVTVRYSGFQGVGVATVSATLHYQDSNCQQTVDLNVNLNNGSPQGPGSSDPDGLQLAKQVGNPNINNTSKAGDPINLFTGAFVMEVPDLTIPGRGINFEWTRTHNGNIIYPKTFELGTSWFNPYLQRLVQKGNDIDFLEGSGRIDTFTSNGVGGFNTPSHHYLELTHDIAAGEFTLKADANLRWVFHDFAQTNAGRLKFVIDRHNNQLSFDYIQINSEPKLKTVTDTFGRVITMTHDSQGRITEVQDFSSDFGSTGRKVSYTYYPPASAGGTDGQLQSVEAPEITGTSTNNDFDTAGANRKTTNYTYTHGFTNEKLRHNIATITDPKGQVYIKNTFATTQNENDLLFNRVIEQQYGEEDQNFQLHYETINETIGNQTATLLIIVNDRRGLVTEQRLNDFGNPVSTKEFTGFADPDLPTTQTGNRPTGKLRATDPDFYETQTDYDSLGKPIEITLPRGNKLITAYDDLAAEEHGQDNVITFTRNVGTVGTIGGIDTDLTTQMTYTDNVFAFMKTMTNPRGFLWEFFYDFDEEPDNTDYNGDGVITPLAQSQGFLFQKKSPDVNLGLSGATTPQVIEEQFEYNQFSQLTKYTDPEGNVTAFIYYPENDPDGDGQNIIAGRDPNTGGYLKQRIVAQGTGPGALNLTTEYEYDDVGNVITVIKPLGYRWSYEVNALNQVVRATSPTMALFDGGDTYEQFFKYDANDNVIETGVEHENSSNPGFANGPGFDEANFFETRFEFDILDNLITKTEEVGNSFPAIYDYDTLVTSYEYDDSYNLVQITHPNDIDEDALLYDERDLLFQQIIGDADTVIAKSITQWDYDLNRNMARTDYPNAKGTGFNEETCMYDGFDRKISCFNLGRNTTWTFAYDKADNQILKRADGPFDTNQSTVVKLSEVRTIFDEIDRPFRLEQDLFRHDTGLGLNGGALTLAVTELAYDADSRLTQTVNPNLHNTFYTYDQADRLKTETDAVGNIAEYFYNLNSMVTQMINTEVKPGGPADVFTWDFEYDERDQMRTTNDDLNQLTQIAIDSRGFVASRTDAEGNQWLSLRDGLGREYQSNRQVTDIDFLTLKNKWDERSRLITFTDGENRETTYQYDSHNRRTLKTNADLTTCQYFYDVADNLVTLIRENDDVITYGYDDADRLILTEYRIDTNPANAPEIADDWAYNGLDTLVFAGERLDTQDPLGGFKFQESYLYESRGLPLDCTQIIGTFSSKTFSKDYDAAGNQLFLDYPNGRRVSYNTYDDLERLTNLTSGPVNITTTYRGYNRWHERDFGNTLTLDVEYDATKRITDFNHQDNNVTPLPEVKVGFQVGYDQVDNKLSELLSRSDKPSKGRIFNYDNYYRTTEFSSDLDVATFNQGLADFSTVPTNTKFHEVNNYDLANNIEDTTLNGNFNDVTNNEMNETESIGQVIENAIYDPLGRLTSYQQDGKEFTLTYNRRDQLIQVDSQDIGDPGSLTTVAQYEYYSSGMRAVKIVPSENLHEHFYGPWMSVYEVYNVNSSVEDSDTSKEFIHDHHSGLDKPLVIFFNHDGVGRKEPYYFHTNTRGDVYALSDENGTIVERYNYSLFGQTEIFPGSLEPPGNTTVISGTGFNGIVAPPQNINGGEFTNESRFGNIFLFGGAQFDYETRFYYMRFRYHFPTLRGFISRDPIWDDSLMNGYAFVENRPGYLIDPWGLDSKETGFWDGFKKSFNDQVEIAKKYASIEYARVSDFGGKLIGGTLDAINVSFEQLEKDYFKYSPGWLKSSDMYLSQLAEKYFPGGNEVALPAMTMLIPGGQFKNLGNLKNVGKISSVNQVKKWTKKGRLKSVGLPTQGKIRYVPPRGYKPEMPLPRGPGKGFKDKFDNEWIWDPVKKEWDVQLSQKGQTQLGHLSKSGKHVNISPEGKVTH